MWRAALSLSSAPDLQRAAGGTMAVDSGTNSGLDAHPQVEKGVYGPFLRSQGHDFRISTLR